MCTFFRRNLVLQKYTINIRQSRHIHQWNTSSCPFLSFLSFLLEPIEVGKKSYSIKAALGILIFSSAFHLNPRCENFPARQKCSRKIVATNCVVNEDKKMGR